MAASHSYYYLISHSKFPFPIHNRFHPQTHKLMFIFFFFFFATFSIFFFFFFLSVHRKSSKRKTEQPQEEEQEPPPTHQTRSLSSIDPSEKTGEPIENESAHLTRSLLLEVLPADSPKWQTLFKAEKAGACCGGGDPESDPFGLVFAEKGDSGGDQRAKKKKKRNRRKSSNSNGGCQEEGDSGPGCCRDKQEVVCLYPFTSSSSMTQRKIKQQYEELMKCYHAKGLTLAQVGQFANCLVEARNELQHKADVIQRKFTITKALLFKADRSSFDRLRQQIYKLELEQKRLEEDAYVYNWLQQRLKVSPAYKKMLEVGALMEMKAKSGELTESTDDECSDISFEELLAQEKKDSFWQRNGKLRSCSS